MKNITGSDIGVGVIGALVALWAINRIQSPAGTPTPMPTPTPIPTPTPTPIPTPIPTPTHPYYSVGTRLVNASGNHFVIMGIVQGGETYDVLDEDGVIGNGPGARFYYNAISLDLNPSWWVE